MNFFTEHAGLLFPLLAAMLYSIAAVALKAAANRGAGTVRTICIGNWVTALAFLAYYDWLAFPAVAEPAWPVLALAGFFFLGNLFTIFAFSKGDVSVATPVLGVKVILVAVMVAVGIGGVVPWPVWVGGILCAAGIAFLQVNDRPHDRKRIVASVVFALLAATNFAAFDTINQYWSPRVGFGRLVPPAMIVAGLLTVALLPLTRGRWADLPRNAVSSLAIGAAFIAGQAMVLIWAIGYYENAAAANVVYGSRGLWGIVFVYLIGSRFDNIELTARHPKVIAARLAGAVLIITAIILAFAAK